MIKSVTNRVPRKIVIPAEAGIHNLLIYLDPGFRRGDENELFEVPNNQIIANIFTLSCSGFRPIWRRSLPDRPEFPTPGEKSGIMTLESFELEI